MNIHTITAAAGFATGAALAFAPFAAADNASDVVSTIDSLVSGLPAASTPVNIDISFDGYTIYDGGGAAVADTGAEGNGNYDLAIAYGDGAYASAQGGTGDYALASGTNANAEAGSMTEGATGNNYDTAIDIGNNGADSQTLNAGAYAGNGSLFDYEGIRPEDVGTATHDSAYDIGNNSAGSYFSGAFAGYYGPEGGNGDTAYDAGNNTGGVFDGAFAGAGDNNFASDSGNNSAIYDYAFAALGNSNSAIADTSYTTQDGDADAYGGDSDYAYVYGPDNSTADAEGGSDVAYVSDPFGGATGPADSAVAGDGSYTNDLAEVLLTHGNATADTANMLYDIVSLFGHSTGSF